MVAAIGGVAIMVASLTGCSGDKSSSSESSKASESSSTSSAASTSVSASAGAGTAKVTIDGQPKDMNGQVVCSAMGGKYNIAIGEGTTGVAVVMAEDASNVSSVGLGNVNGVTLGFQEGAPGGKASATKDGKTYKISGEATGVDMANPMQPVTKPFEIEVTCP
jgi:lipoprotein LpqH